MLLSAFVSLCEGFLGVLLMLELWGEFFQSKLGTIVAGVPAPCGAYVAMRRSGKNNPFPSIPLIQSVKLWARRLGGNPTGVSGPGHCLNPGTQPSPGFG